MRRHRIAVAIATTAYFYKTLYVINVRVRVMHGAGVGVHGCCWKEEEKEEEEEELTCILFSLLVF